MGKQYISVAMCTYNGAQYLREQLDSIACQTRLPDELVVCDDRSHDSTAEIIKAFAAKAPFPVRLIINEENLGSTKNFEKAIELCQGAIIALSDQDDVWYKEKLMRIEVVLSTSSRISAVFTDAEVVDERLGYLGYRLWDSIGFSSIERRLVQNGRVFETLLKHNVVTGATMAFKAKYRDIILPIPYDWIHDAWIALILSAISQIIIIPECLIKYRQHTEQQIGAERKSIKEQLALAKDRERKTNLINHYYKYLVAYEYLERDVDFCRRQCVNLLGEKLKHLKARYSLEDQKRNNLFIIIKEILSLRYFKYSNGWKSVAKDVFL